MVIGKVSAVWTSATCSGVPFISTIAQPAPTPWIIRPVFDNRLAVQIRRKRPCFSGSIISVEIMPARPEEHTSELQSLMRISYAVFCLKKKKNKHLQTQQSHQSQTTARMNIKT